MRIPTGIHDITTYPHVIIICGHASSGLTVLKAADLLNLPSWQTGHPSVCECHCDGGDANVVERMMTGGDGSGVLNVCNAFLSHASVGSKLFEAELKAEGPRRVEQSESNSWVCISPLQTAYSVSCRESTCCSSLPRTQQARKRKHWLLTSRSLSSDGLDSQEMSASRSLPTCFVVFLLEGCLAEACWHLSAMPGLCVISTGTGKTLDRC